MNPHLLDWKPIQDNSRFKVGIVWRGNPLQARDIVRSMSFQQIESLLKLAEKSVHALDIISLNIDKKTVQELADHPRENCYDPSTFIQDMNDTAYLMEQLDLVITVDTSLAHLAGAIGVPTWTMLCHTPDWRWGIETTHAPWYPEMKVYRQPAFGDWGSVIQQVERDLDSLIESKIQ